MALSYTYKSLRPSQVSLDPENPRLPDGTSGDRDAINRLLDEGFDALLGLARDMARTGETNPAELPIAIKSGNKYVVLEGNRRFAALKLLKDCRLASDEERQKAFRRAASLGTPPKSVYTLVASTPEEAEHWIFLRHTGENNGVGVRRWNASQTATHRRRANVTIDAGTARAITIADELEEAYTVESNLIELIRLVRRDKLTNIGRLFSPDVLSAVDLSISTDKSTDLRARTLWARHTAEQLHDFFDWAFKYLSDKPVDAFKNARIRELALQEVAHLVPSAADAVEPFRLADQPYRGGRKSPPSTESFASESNNGSTQQTNETDAYGLWATSDPAQASSAGDSAETETDSTDQVVVTSGSSRRETKPERYLFHKLRLPRHPERVQRLLKECRSLDLEAAAGTACVMVRVLVELSVSSPKALALSAAEERDSLKHKIVAMLRYLDPDIEHPTKGDRELTQAYLEASDLGIRYLNGFVHNPSVVPDQHLARRFSSAFAPFLQRIDEALPE